jgi:hypothetical protein
MYGNAREEIVTYSLVISNSQSNEKDPPPPLCLLGRESRKVTMATPRLSRQTINIRSDVVCLTFDFLFLVQGLGVMEKRGSPYWS